MKLIAFVPVRPKPQPRTTQRSKFLFGKTVEQWEQVDADNKIKADHGVLNKKNKPVKATRYAYRLQRLQEMNQYRANIYDAVCRACNNGEYFDDSRNIPKNYLFVFYLFHSPKSWSKKKYEAHIWQLHDLKPDEGNIVKGLEDALFVSDSDVTGNAHYKLYVPHETPQGILILKSEEIHRFVIDTAVSDFISKLTI